MKVLVCPLDWGIGHATRCVPVISKFIEFGDDVVIAADGRPLEFLKKEFPKCRFVRLRGAKVIYPKGNAFVVRMIRLTPAFIRSYFRERKDLAYLIRKENPQIIVSDNRYGLWSKKWYSILITHQLRLVLPTKIRIFSGVSDFIVMSLVKKFDECWIPDFELHNGLAGRLSHPPKLPLNAFYTGTLSRFSLPAGKKEIQVVPDFDVIIALSGPEPQRTILENMIFSQVKNSGLSGVIVRGMTESDESWDLTDMIRVFSHLPTQEMRECLLRSHIVICRPGYSTLMDLVTLGRKAILIPTPGQSEQEYLARYLMEKKIYFSMPQADFDLLYAIEMTRNFPGMTLNNDLSVLAERILEVRKNAKDRNSEIAKSER